MLFPHTFSSTCIMLYIYIYISTVFSEFFRLHKISTPKSLINASLNRLKRKWYADVDCKVIRNSSERIFPTWQILVKILQDIKFLGMIFQIWFFKFLFCSSPRYVFSSVTNIPPSKTAVKFLPLFYCWMYSWKKGWILTWFKIEVFRATLLKSMELFIKCLEVNLFLSNPSLGADGNVLISGEGLFF